MFDPKTLDFIKVDAQQFIPEGVDRPTLVQSALEFARRSRKAIRLILIEKELITFALLQLASLAIGYYLFIEIFDWVPAEFWSSVEKGDEPSIAQNIFIIVWMSVCIWLVTLPFGVFNSCMVATHVLHHQNRPSTIASCLQLVLPKIRSIWIFHFIDGLVTVGRIYGRIGALLDKDRDLAKEVIDEMVYYAWKFGSLGVLPSLVTGRDLLDAGKESVAVLKHKFADVALLRGSYSTLCWVVGIGVFPVGQWFFQSIEFSLQSEGVYTFYRWFGIPLFLCVVIIQLVLRPIFMLSSCDIYLEYLEENDEPVTLPEPPSTATSTLVGFLVGCFIVAAVMFYREELGILHLLATPLSAGSPE